MGTGMAGVGGLVLLALSVGPVTAAAAVVVGLVACWEGLVGSSAAAATVLLVVGGGMSLVPVLVLPALPCWVSEVEGAAAAGSAAGVSDVLMLSSCNASVSCPAPAACS
jgi:hypothetical protein